jgi:ABC-type amino acid transport system permease subunit
MLIYVAATCVLWALSGGLAVATGLAAAVGSASTKAVWRRLSGAAITLSRGLPTSLLVLAAGVISIRIPPRSWVPDPFPGTPSQSAPVAWAVMVALAVGSAGHFAVIFRAAYATLGRARTEQAVVLGMPPVRRLWLLSRESALAAIPPTSARLVHHLHNTAFAALFPVADLFGWIENGANATFDITRYVVAGGAAYVLLSGLIWAGFKGLEVRLGRHMAPARAGARLPVTVVGAAR